MQKILILMCGNFSSTGDGPFVLPELNTWEDMADRIIVVAARHAEDRPSILSTKVELVDLNMPETWKIPIGQFLLWGMRLLLQKRFWLELKDILRFAPQLKNVYCAISKYTYQIQAEKKAAQYLSQHPISSDDEVILYSYWLDYIAGLAAELQVNGKVVKRISRAHGYDLYEDQPGNGYMPWRRERLAKLDHVYTASQAGADFLKSRFPEYQDKITCAYLGSEDFGIQKYVPSETLRLISCSWLVPVKRVNKIIETLSHIRNIPVKWTHIGTGPEEEKLKHLALKILPPNVQCDWRGALPHEQVKTICQTECFDLFISASVSEGMPVSMMEALSAGIPVISTAVGGVPEIVRPGETGWLLDSDESEWPDVLNEYVLLTLPNRMNYRTRVRQFWENTVSAEKNAEQFIRDVL